MSRRSQIILVVVLLAVVAGFSLFLIIKKRAKSQAVAPIIERSVSSVDESRKDRALSSIFGGAPISECEKAGPEEAIDGCYFEIATARVDGDICGQVRQSEKRDRCYGIVTTTLVQSGGSSASCASLADGPSRLGCIRAAVGRGATKTFCDQFEEVERDFCNDVVLFKRGLAGDAAACAALKDATLQEECGGGQTIRQPAPVIEARDADNDGLTREEEARIGTDPHRFDTDGDGLSDRDEVRRWKTDPKKADTDGDGFSDATEIERGYNPLGPGRL